MDRAERDRSIEREREREAKLELVGDVLAHAGCIDLYERITAEQAERLHDAMMARIPSVAVWAILHWAETMATDTVPGSVRYVEGWNNGLSALATRIRREFGCERH